MNNVPNIFNFGAAKRPIIDKIRGLRGSKGVRSDLANFPEIIDVYVFPANVQKRATL